MPLKRRHCTRFQIYRKNYL